MLKFTCKANSDIMAELNAKIAEFKAAVRAKSDEVGKRAMQTASQRGAATGASQRVMASNGYSVDDDGTLTIYNGCGYADRLESDGKDVISGAALEAERELNQIHR